MVTKESIATRFQAIQDSICAALEQADGKAKFVEDLWERDGGGGGRTRILQHGNLIEKGGVNFSAVHGDLPDVLVKEMKLEATTFYATGVSIVLHPNNPNVPIIHMNIRYFEMGNGTCWFGGGIDLTPHYVDKERAKRFHQRLKDVCDRFNAGYYPKFKEWADNYFYNEHREETRGVGGIFFDQLRPNEEFSKEDRFGFVEAVGEAFADAYLEQAALGRDEAFTPEQKQWQNIRRGRYVEFNLVYDRGTKFGLQTKGRIESILMSLPENAGWVYNYQAAPGSPEEQTLNLLKKGVDWLA